MNPKLKMLCELYNRSDENVNVDALLRVCFFKNFKEVLKLLSHKQQVKFAYLCAKSVSHLLHKKDSIEKAEILLKNVKRWIENPRKIEANNYYGEKIFNISLDRFFYPECVINESICSIFYYNVAACYASSASSYILSNTYNKTKKNEIKNKHLGFLIKVIRDEC